MLLGFPRKIALAPKIFNWNQEKPSGLKTGQVRPNTFSFYFYLIRSNHYIQKKVNKHENISHVSQRASRNCHDSHLIFEIYY